MMQRIPSQWLDTKQVSTHIDRIEVSVDNVRDLPAGFEVLIEKTWIPRLLDSNCSIPRPTNVSTRVGFLS